MNLQSLFEKQAELDKHIEAQHPSQPGVDRLPKKILALQVEIGELANEWRGFKFWSKDQEMRITKTCNECKGNGELVWAIVDDELRYIKCGRCNGSGTRNPLLEEYVDCLHFILSIGLELDDEIADWDFRAVESFKPYGEKEITEQFIDMFSYVNGLRNLKDSEDIYEPVIMTTNLYIGLGEMLGFEWEEVEEAYESKNRTNHKRQELGY